MKKLIHSLLAYAVQKAKKSKLMQSLVEAPFEMNSFPKKASFTDSYNNTFDVLDGLRSKIKPGWEGMFQAKQNAVSGLPIEQFLTAGKVSADKIIPFIASFGKDISTSTILEVGCNSGAASYALASHGAKKIVGSEFSGYKIASVDADNVTESRLTEVNQELKGVRAKLATKHSNSDRVSFVDDDICNSKLKKNSFDIICSWDVLEHLHNTEQAFASMASLLADNGLLIHEYNPFFCLNGGHSLCTLDFLWGHTRLGHNDFVKYLDEIRPEEKEMAYSFYQEGMNRMAMADLKANLKSAGLEIVSLIPFVKEQHVRMMDSSILKQTQVHYPQVELVDLVSPKVVIVAKKAKA